MQEIKSEVTTLITPEIMAKAFWSMNCEEQANFFEQLANEINGDEYHAQMQFLWMTDEIKKKPKETISCFLSFTAFAYDYWPQKTESQFTGA